MNLDNKKFYTELSNWYFRALKFPLESPNIIRLLIRLLFIWFMKEKKLIPADLFDLKKLQKNILKKISPLHEENKEGIYYKAILQNLFFATLNCRERGFSSTESCDYQMRYKEYFKDPCAFLEMVNQVTPFLNDGLFECLDQDKDMIIPDYLFFGTKEKGLINILKSYKFTLAENTPMEEDVALDPELLARVFENLPASYNPETKRTARKQTGSFYSPREIVNYMVDESLMAHLKNAVSSREIIHTLDNCKVLDPACGSGAFTMGILQKMVHILQKVDPNNQYWQALQLEKVRKGTKDKKECEQLLKEINEAFDQSINNPDYARKLFLIKNCIYGVDIQPMAVQISKLRFFISLIIEQKVNQEKDNLGIRPLPNLETRFVTANTLIGIDKFESDEQLANWDPYDQNSVAPFFDPEWMLGVKDGFDVVIGNPPYGAKIDQELKKYLKNKYQSAQSKKGLKGSLNSFSLFSENAILNANSNAQIYFIVPMTISSSDAMTSLHELIFNCCEIIKISTYSNRPKKIFDSADQRIALFYLYKNNKPTKHIFSTKVNKRYSNEMSIQDVIDNLEFVDSYKHKIKGRFPKVGKHLEINILDKIFKISNTLKDFKVSKGLDLYYRKTGGRYYNIITNFSNGSSAEEQLMVIPQYRDTICAILSSNLYYWYHHIYSDNLNMKVYEIESFPIPLINMPSASIQNLEKLYQLYITDLEKNAKVVKANYANTSSFKKYKARLSKHIIDKIDQVIYKFYGLTETEFDFIINYDKKFRT